MSSKFKWQLKRLINFLDKKINVSISTKIMIPFFVVAITIIGALSYFATVRINNGIAEMEQRRANSVMQNTLRDFQKEVQNVEVYTRLLADSGELKSAINDANKTVLYELLIPVKYYARQQKVALYDKNGQLLIQLSNSASRPPEEKFVPLALAG